MTPNQEKILNYLLFFLLSLTGLASLLLVKNNYLYVFILIFLILYWQRFRMNRVSASFPRFLILGLVGILLFQISSGSPHFRERPVVTFALGLIFYLPYFFLWYKLWLKGKISLLGAFFLSGLLGILVLGLASGKLINTVLTAPNLVAGLLYALLKAGGIVSVVGSLTAFPFIFFSEEGGEVSVLKAEKKSSSGFGLIEILVGVSLFLTALGLVGAARQRPLPLPSTETKKDRRDKKEDQAQVQEESPQPSTKDEVKRPRTQAGGSFSAEPVVDPAACQAIPSLAGCEIYSTPSSYYDPYSDPNSPEYQQHLMEQWYASQQDPAALFFSNPVQLWSQDPVLYEMFQGIYGVDPLPGLPDLIPGLPW